jgi:hypothetical protein
VEELAENEAKIALRSTTESREGSRASVHIWLKIYQFIHASSVRLQKSIQRGVLSSSEQPAFKD